MNLVPPKKIDENIKQVIDSYSVPISEVDYDVDALKSELQDIMWDYAGILRTEESLLKGLDLIYKLNDRFDRKKQPRAGAAKNA